MSTLLGYRRAAQGIDPPYDHPDYVSTHKRAPRQAPIRIAHTLSEITGPGLGAELVGPGDADLTRFAGGEALGERIIVTGRVLNERGEPVPNTLLEIWQANASGRYLHKRDQWPGPLDPNFLGMGRCLTNEEGVYRFLTIRPGAYPWLNHPNAWRPAHIHFAVFGPSMLSRLVTQMYFPDDPLHSLDPIMNAVPTEQARKRLIAAYDHDVTEQEWALGYRWDIVVRGPYATPFES